MTLVFLDTETTGLDPSRHEVWELAYAVDDGDIEGGVVYHSTRYADPTALMMNGYHDRTYPQKFSDMQRLEIGCRAALEGATIVGANPAFDTAFLRARWGVAPWHHRLWDVEAYAAGVHGLNSLSGLAVISAVLRDLGHDIPKPDHSAVGDVATLRASFYALHSIRKHADRADAKETKP
jgi:DNA polymerase-3 subunit epsilon